MAQPNAYYRPYISDSEDSETDSGSESGSDSGSTTQNNQPNYRKFASDLQLVKAGGPNFPTLADQVTFHRPDIMSLYESTDISGVPLPKIKSQKKLITSVIMLDSRDRDINVYPQPTLLTLRLPRVYRNMTNFQIVQINFLSSFFYFRADKNNLSITIKESGRYIQNKYGFSNIVSYSTPGATPLKVTTTIREGTYDINTLITELTQQLNFTPIFYDFIDGLTSFHNLFQSTGDYSVNFNTPGDTFYDNLNNVFITSPTMTTIVQKYFQNTIATPPNGTNFTPIDIKVAYYYPVLKEILLDDMYGATSIDLTNIDTSTLLPGETIITRCIYTFQGLADKIVIQVIDKNINVDITVSTLDKYRLEHTFRYNLINKYSVTYSTNNNRIIISSAGLNTSLTNLLTNRYNYFFSSQLQQYGLSLSNYNVVQTVNQQYLALITDMYTYLQNKLAIYFGINFNTYALSYFVDLNNQLPLQEALQNTGISITYDSSVIFRNLVSITSNTLTNFQQPVTTYWPTLSNISKTITSNYNLNSSQNPVSISDYSHPYNSLIGDLDYTKPFIDANGIIYQNNLYKSGNVIASINPESYTVFKFHSNIRQTLRVTVLPRPLQYRFPLYNATTSYPAIFDNSYCFIDNANFDIPTITLFTPSVANTYAAAIATATNNTIDINNSRRYYTFVAPPATGAIAGTVYKYPLTISAVYQTAANFPVEVQMFFYHDRAALMADINSSRNENALNYIKSTGAFTNWSQNTITFNAYANQTYYVLFRSIDINITIVPFTMVVYYPSGMQVQTPLTTSLIGFNPLVPDSNNFNYMSVADPDFIRLPIQQSLWQSNAKGVDANYSFLGTNYVKMGYDSNVSNDLTDYVGYFPNTLSNCYPTAVIRIDPISGYIFQVGNGYNSTTQTYLDGTTSFGNLNQLLTSNAEDTAGTVTPPTRETSIVHWYSQVFLPNSANQPYAQPSSYAQIFTADALGKPQTLYSYPYVQEILYPTIYSKSSSLSSDLKGYTFSDNKISLGNGVVGISLVPDDGVWDVTRIMFRSAYTDPLQDPNRAIQYLGIFPASYLNTLTSNSINLTSSLMTFEVSKVNTYSSNNTSNYGFETGVGGTYYEWTKKTGVQFLSGFAQTPGKMVPDSNSYYSIVPFTANSNLTTYSLLSGSVVPNPYYSDASASKLYLDGLSTPTGTYVITPVPKANPTVTLPAGFDQSQSRYEQSVPIGTTLLQYLSPPLFSSDSSGCKPFDISGSTLFKARTGSSASVLGNLPYLNPCFRVQNYALFSQGGIFAVYSYARDTQRRAFIPVVNITADILFTNIPNTQLVGISGNNSVFAFLGLTANSTTNGFAYSLAVEIFDPVLKQITSTSDIIVLNTRTTTPSTGLLGSVTNPLFPALDIITTAPITAIASDGANVAYVTSTSLFTSGMYIYITGATYSGFNGTKTISALVPSSSTQTITSSSGNGTNVTHTLASTSGFTVGGYVTIANSIFADFNGITVISGVSTGAFTVSNNSFGTINATVTGPINNNFPSIQPRTISGITGTGSSVTYTITSGNTTNFTGKTVVITGAYPSTLNGTFTITASTATTFTIANTTVLQTPTATTSSCIIVASSQTGPTSTAVASIQAASTSFYEIINVTSFNYNILGGFTFAFQYGTWNPILQVYENIKSLGVSKGTAVSDTTQPYFLVQDLPGIQAGLQPTYELIQGPNEIFGRFFVAAKTAFAASDYPTNLNYAVREPMIVNTVLYNTNPLYSRNGIFLVDPRTTYTFSDIGLNLSNITAPYVYKQSNISIVPEVTRLVLITDGTSASAFGGISIVQNPYDNKLLLSYDMSNISSLYYEFISYATTVTKFTSNATFIVSKQSITSYNHTPIAPYQVLGGGGGSLWTLFNEGNRITNDGLTYDTVWGNRGDAVDFPVGISNAYQIFYPTQRIVMRKIARSYNPMTDISGVSVPEWPHTALFAYDTESKFLSDISSNKWGMESNYISANTNLSSGYYFNACDLDIPLFSTTTPYYIALRGYTPSEKSQVMVRFSLPNRYDFGYVRITDLISEISLTKTSPTLFNSNYANVIQQFNSNFIFTPTAPRTFGANIIPGYAGSNYSNISGFGDFMTAFINLYTIFNSNVQTVTNITQGTSSNLQGFITSNLSAILPESAQNRQRYTDPITYSILWRSALPPQYVNEENNWGLGWNLGYTKEDTPYSTSQIATSFYKILDDYVNLRLNSEYDMNHMDTGSKENLQITQDTTGSLKSYYGKLLLNTFGSYSQTMISNPIEFNIPIPKIDKLTFAWYDNIGTVINNNDCEWTVVIQIVEQIDLITAEDAGIPIPQ